MWIPIRCTLHLSMIVLGRFVDRTFELDVERHDGGCVRSDEPERFVNQELRSEEQTSVDSVVDV